MRLAWFTPWPPQQSGIAGRSAELVAALAARGYGVDVFLDEQDDRVRPCLEHASNDPPGMGSVRLQSAHQFVWRAARGQYDLTVYQLGNSHLHEFVWPYLFQYPGLVLLHDARLHHARGRALLRRHQVEQYRQEFAWNHPEVSPDLAELAVRGFEGPYYYQWPMTRAVVAASKAVGCHSRGATDELRARWPSARVEYVALGEGAAHASSGSGRARFRSAHGIDPSAVVLGVHGALTAEKRVPQILRAFAATRPWLGRACLLLAGRVEAPIDLARQIETMGLRDVTYLIDGLSDEEFDAAIAATDVSLNLRWPTALETSGPWVRSLAQSRATVILDLAHNGHLPVLDPRTWRRHAPCDTPSEDADLRAVAVAIDILDEDHSLRLAMRRLATDAPLRERLGREARQYWAREHTLERMVGDVERVIGLAAAAVPPGPPLPIHMRPNPASVANRWMASVGLTPAAFDLWNTEPDSSSRASLD
jgi:glycosyltransferase involved in cell wall biosynthesis